MSYYLGIDGGGSTIRAALVDQEKTVLEHFKLARNANPTSTGFEYLKATLQMIQRRIMNYSKDITHITISLAGVGTEQQSLLTRETVLKVFENVQQVFVYHDAQASLLANSPKAASILVICGTGSVVVGKDQKEGFYRVGGWGYLLGDEASGFWLVKRLFQEYLRFQDGVRKDDQAFDVFRKHFESQPRNALYRFYEADHRRDTASLSALFLDQGYSLAQNIITEGIISIRQIIQALKGKIKDPVQRVIYMGGMFDNPFFLNQFKQIIGDTVPLVKGKKDIECTLAMLGKDKEGIEQT